jgi:hypothetical protein
MFVAVLLVGCQTAPTDARTTTTTSAQPTMWDAAASPGDGQVAATTATAQTTINVRKVTPMISKEMTTKADSVEMKATFHVQPDRVEVDFVVTNAGPTNIYLTDFDFDSDTNGSRLRLDRLPVHYEPPNTAVLVSRLLPLNPNAKLLQPPAAYATKVAPGETYRTSLSAPIPLRIQGARQQEPDVECTRIRVELGVIPESPDLDPKPMTIAGKFRLGTPAWKHQKVLAVETDLTVPMITK